MPSNIIIKHGKYNKKKNYSDRRKDLGLVETNKHPVIPYTSLNGI